MEKENNNTNKEDKKSQKYKRKPVQLLSIYSRSLITRPVIISIVNIGKNIQETLEKFIISNFEGKCIVEGFVKPNTTKIITFSSGVVKSSNIIFEVVFECSVCCPVEGMLINCTAKNITKAGIRAESSDENPSPIIVFITRDHHYNMKYFSTIKENDNIIVRIIGQRFELNDKYVSIIAELVEPKDNVQESYKKHAKPTLVIED